MRKKERMGPGIDSTLAVPAGVGVCAGAGCDTGAVAGADVASCACVLIDAGPSRPLRMTSATNGRRTDRFIGTLSKRSRDKCEMPVPKDNPPPKNLRRRFRSADRAARYVPGRLRTRLKAARAILRISL